MIGKTVGQYEIIEKIGQGGMGLVYKAVDKRLDRTVAIKVLPPHVTEGDAEKQRFNQEAKATSALDHPNICTIYEINETDDGATYIAMAYYDGETLRERIARGNIGVDEALRIAMGIGRGLQRAHENGITHRDVKPANVIITRRGDIKVIDFGVAKLARGSGLTRTGSTLGTVAYMSPEQARGDAVDQQTDIWALGVILYEMLAGARPFKGDFDQAVVYFILNEDPAPLHELNSAVPPELSQIARRALLKSKDDRYPSMAHMVNDMRALVTGEQPTLEMTSAATAVTWVSDAKPNRHRWPLIVTAGILIAGLAAFAGARFLGKDNGDATVAETSSGSATHEPAAVIIDTTTTEETTDPSGAKDDDATDTETKVAESSVPTPPPPPAEKKTTSPTTTSPKEPNTPTKEPQPQKQKMTAAVRTLRDGALNAREKAEDVRADQIAPEAFAKAQQQFDSGMRSALDGDMTSATIELTTAASSFDVARQQAQTRARALGDKRAACDAARSACEKQARFFPAYATATALEERAKRESSAGEVVAATRSFEEAAAAYATATTELDVARGELAALLDAYDAALEREDLPALESMWIRFPADQHTSWENFFEAVDNLSVQMTPDEIVFDKDGATSEVNAEMSYSGAGSSDATFLWRIRFRKPDTRWLIDGVEQIR